MLFRGVNRVQGEERERERILESFKLFVDLPSLFLLWFSGSPSSSSLLSPVFRIGVLWLSFIGVYTVVVVILSFPSCVLCTDLYFRHSLPHLFYLFAVFMSNLETKEWYRICLKNALESVRKCHRKKTP